MFSKNKNNPPLTSAQHEQMEYAQKRISQKKRLYRHFVIFLLGAVFAILINRILKYGEAYDWYIWVILVWGFLVGLHAINVFVTAPFMGVEWERKEREKLVQKQRDRITEIQKEIETEFPLSRVNKKKEEWED